MERHHPPRTSNSKFEVVSSNLKFQFDARRAKFEFEFEVQIRSLNFNFEVRACPLAVVIGKASCCMMNHCNKDLI